MKKVSILGDSISTFEGFNPEGYAVYYDKEKQAKNGLESVNDTWWAKVIKALDGELCVNNSYSGSRVSGADFPSTNNMKRLEALKKEDCSPDYILINMGTNDFGYGVKIAKSNYYSVVKPDCRYFLYAYDIMLKNIMSLYPNAKIVCSTIMKTEVQNEPSWFFNETYGGIERCKYNEVIRKITLQNKCYLADTQQSGVVYDTLDGAHPTKQGHSEIAEVWIKCLSDLKLINN